MDDCTREQIERKILQIPITKAFSGMVLARDVLARNGQLILTKDTILEPSEIARILFYGVSSLFVYQISDIYHGESYYSNIKKSQEFEEFHKEYCEVLQELKMLMHDTLLEKAKVNEQQLIKSVSRVTERSRGRYHIFELMHCIQEQDDMTFTHSLNVAAICNVFGPWLHMKQEDIEILTLCGLMHDVGKINIPKQIINKPGKLTEEEFMVVRKHPYQGYLLLSEQKIDKRIPLAALQHHERYDGSGYPLRRKGDQIHPFSMITAIADVFDAMTSKRVYRDALCPFSVFQLFDDRGRYEYNLEVSLPLMERIAEIYINHTVQLNNEAQGEVIMINRHALSRPIVKVQNDFIDLSKHRELCIEMVV